jgi:sigma-E factor negative regulatory protein RseB
MPAVRMLRHWLPLLALCAAFVPVAAAQVAPLTPGQAQAWLVRINRAASQGNYRGTLVFTAAGGAMSSSKVAHVCIGDQVYEKVEALDGHQHRVYRHNQTVHTVWPQRRVVVVEPRTDAPSLLATRRQIEPRALDHYSLRLQGSSVVAGRPAQLLMLEPQDSLRFAQRLWADDSSGLLLRADVIGADGRVLESSAFGEVQIGGRADPQAVLDGMSPAGYQVVPSRREAVDFEAQGWRLRAEVPGFRLMGCVKRPPPAQASEASALQAIFSDGLSFVSVFIEPYREQQQALVAEMGALHTVMQRLDVHWITVMGDVPQQTLQQFLSALERRR